MGTNSYIKMNNGPHCDYFTMAIRSFHVFYIISAAVAFMTNVTTDTDLDRATWGCGNCSSTTEATVLPIGIEIDV